MKYKYVIFDFDGVIVDSWLGIAKGFVKCLGEYGITETIESVKKMIGPPFAHLIVEKYGFSKEEGAKAIMIHRKYVQEKGIYEAQLYDGVYEMLETLYNNGVTLAIASNKPIINVSSQCDYFNITKFFKFIDAQDDLQTRGNKSDLVRETMKVLGDTYPKETLMIGDKKTDIVGGKDNNTDTVIVKYGYGHDDEIASCGADYCVESPLDIVSIVLGEKN